MICFEDLFFGDSKRHTFFNKATSQKTALTKFACGVPWETKRSRAPGCDPRACRGCRCRLPGRTERQLDGSKESISSKRAKRGAQSRRVAADL